jgi:hypothetical protein
MQANARKKPPRRWRIAFAVASIATHLAIIAAIFLAMPARKAPEVQKPIVVAILPMGRPPVQAPPKKPEEKALETLKPKVKPAKVPMRVTTPPPPEVPGYLAIIWARLCGDIDPVTQARLGMPWCGPPPMDEAAREAARARADAATEARAARRRWKSGEQIREERAKMAPVDTCTGAKQLCGTH